MVYAKAEVDAVFDKVESRLFPFLQRQHGFFAMQIRSAKHVVGGLLHYLFGTKSPQEIQNAAFMVSLMDRVIQPEQLNLNVERIFGETLQVYMDNVNDGISRLRLKYRIPDDVWKRHVNDLSSIYLRNSSRGFTPFTAKVLLTGSTVTFMSVAGTMAKNTTVKLCRTMTTSMKSFVPRFARNIVSKLTLRSGTKLLGTAATVGILGWELWEHRNFHKYVLPVIHQEMKSYLVLVKERILNDPVSGVCMTIKQWGAQLIAAVYDKQDHAEM
jgi:hypothetical protein